MFQKAKTKFGKLIMLLLVVVCTVCLAIGLVGCSGDARSISSVAINDAGHLIITWSDSEEQDLGLVVGADGENGAPGDDGATGATGNGIAKVEIDENGNLVVYYTADETTGVTVGPIKGDKGDTGAAGVGIKDITIDENGELVITLTDDTVLRPGTVVGDKGETGATGVGISSIDYNTETGDLTITLSNEQTYTFNIKGQDGANGVGIANIDLKQVQEDDNFTEEGLDVVGTYYWEITYTDSTEEVPHIDRIALPMLTEEVCAHENLDTWVLQEHTYNAATDTVTNGVYLDVCIDCGWTWIVRDEARHNFEEGVPVAPTCTEPGYITKSCKCGYVAEKEIDPDHPEPLDHDYQAKDVINPDEPTCTFGHQVIYVCSRCGDVDESRTEYVEARGHYSYEWRVQNPPTTTQTGTMTAVCSGCGHVLTEVLPMLNRTDYEFSTDREVCTLAGTDTYVYTIPEELVPTDAEWALIVEQAAEEGITLTDEDRITSFTFEDPVEGGQHTLNGMTLDQWYAQATSGEDMSGTVYKTEAGVYLFNPDKVLDANGDKLITEFPDQTPDCGEMNGRGYFVCPVCEWEVYVDTFRAHNYVEDESQYVAPTCTEPGQRVSICSSCGDRLVEEIAALEHQLQLELVEDGVAADGSTPKFDLVQVCQRPGCNYSEVIENDITEVSIDLAEGSEDATCLEELVYDVTYTPAAGGDPVTTQITMAKGHHTLNGVLQNEAGIAQMLTRGWIRQIDNVNYYNPDVIKDAEGNTLITEFPDDVSTCVEAGRGYYRCPICQDLVYVDTMRAHEVDPDADTTTIDVLPTCEEAGSGHGTCIVCGTPDLDVVIPATGHSFVYTFTLTNGEEIDLNTVKVGDTLEGTLNGDCANCDATDVREISATVTEVVPASCAAEGTGGHITYTYKNENNEDRTGTIEFAKPNHTLTVNGVKTDITTLLEENGAIDITKYAGITEFPDNTSSCAPDAPNAIGRGYFTCADCGELVYVDTCRSHVAGSDLEVTTPATCTTNGEGQFTCEVCGTKVGNQVIQATGHSYEIVVIDVPTTAANGSAELRCTKCGDVVSGIVIPALTQSNYDGEGEYALISNPTCTRQGYEEYTFNYVQNIGNPNDADATQTLSLTFGNVVEMVAHSEYVEGTDRLLSWTVTDEDGVTTSYTGYECTVCHQVVVLTSQITNRPAVNVSNDTELAAAIAAAQDGTVINLAGGTYNMNIVIRFKNITLVGAEDGSTIINGYINIGTNNSHVSYSNGFVTLRNLTIVNTEANTTAQMGVSIASNEVTSNLTLTIENCVIDGFLFGVQLGGSAVTDSDLVITNTAFANNWCAISIGQAANEYSVNGCTFNNVIYQLQDYRNGNNYYTTIGDSEPARTNNDDMPTVEEWYDTVHANDGATA